MNLVICLKQIPDPSIVEFDLSEGKMESIVWCLNQSDFHALEEGLRIKEECGGEVIVVSVAPERGDAILKKALTYGADRAIRIWNSSLDGVDTWVRSSVLADVIKKTGFDFVICGNRSRDTGSALMGAVLSERLNTPLVAGVVDIEIKDQKKCIANKRLERGGREAYSFALPAVITVDEVINQPRYVAMFSRTYKEGVKKSIEIVEAKFEETEHTPLMELSRIGQPKPRTKIGKKVSGLSMMDLMKVLRGETGGKKEIFTGSPREGAVKIEKKFKELLF